MNRRGQFVARAVVNEEVRPGVVASYGVRWPRLSEGGATVNDTTSDELSDLGGGAVFYDNAVEVEAIRPVGPGLEPATTTRDLATAAEPGR